MQLLNITVKIIIDCDDKTLLQDYILLYKPVLLEHICFDINIDTKYNMFSIYGEVGQASLYYFKFIVNRDFGLQPKRNKELC